MASETKIEKMLTALRAAYETRSGLILGSDAAILVRDAIRAAEAPDADDRLKAHSDYSIDLARIIEDLCHGNDIRVPQTSARFHYDMAVAYRASLTSSNEHPIARCMKDLQASQRINRLETALREIEQLGLGPDQGSSAWQAMSAHQIAQRALKS